MVVEKYLDEILKLDKDNIKSVALIGSYASKINYIPKKSDIDILVIFNYLNFELLNLIMPITCKYKAKHNISSLPLSIDYVNQSLDVFPIEFFDMQLSNKVLYGEDVLNKLSFLKNDMRLECEQQIKASIIKLRSYFLEYGISYKSIINLLLTSFKSLFPVFRSLVFLHGEQVELDNKLLIGQLSKIIDYDFFAFQTILKSLYFNFKISKKDIVKTFENYLNQLKYLSEYIDKLETKND